MSGDEGLSCYVANAQGGLFGSKKANSVDGIIT